MLESNRRLEARYERALGKIVGRLHARMVDALEPKIPLFAAGKSDAGHSPVGTTIDGVLLEWSANLPRTVGPVFDQHAKDVSKANARALTLVGVKPSDLRIAGDITNARNANLAYIENAGRVYTEDVREIFEDPATFGQSVKEITGRLIDRGNVSESRARLIARDQTLKLNGAITKTRQTNAGITRYTWSTSLDERVRPEHAALEGQVFDWTSPPEPGHPGEDFQCRCVAIPVIEDLEATDEPPPAEEEATPAEEEAAPDVPELLPEEEPPPPPPPELEAGTHAEAIQVERGPLEQQGKDVLARFATDDTARAALEQTPLTSLSLKSEAKVKGKSVGGFYSLKKSGAVKELVVKLDWKHNEIAHAWLPGNFLTVASTAPTAEEAALTALHHELGHHLMLHDYFQAGEERSPVMQMVKAAYTKAKRVGRFLSEYASTDEHEFFAEVYSAWVTRRADLAAFDPAAVKLVEDVLRFRGLLS